MIKEELIALTIIGVAGYAVFHSHRLNQDCWLCKYRGLAFLLGSVGLGVYLGFDRDEFREWLNPTPDDYYEEPSYQQEPENQEDNY